jgi:uncharacterized protein (TIGR02246 family)
MDSLAARIERLEAIEAIRNLIAHYGVLADSGDAAGVAALWREEGEYDVGGYGVARGSAAIAALIESETHHSLMDAGCAHVLSPHHIELDGDRATAAGYSAVYRLAENGPQVWRVSHNLWYLARESDGSWLVTRRINRPLQSRGPADEPFTGLPRRA